MLKSDLIEAQLDKDIDQLESSNHNLKFYHPDINKEESEIKLLEYKRDSNIDSNVYLLRNESHNSKNFILSALETNECVHYSIKHVEDCYFRISNDLIHGIEALVEKFKIEHFVLGQYPPSWTFKFGYTQLLHRVVQNECYNLLFKVLTNPKCTQINSRNSLGRTALHEAVLRGSQMAEVLLKSGASLNLRDSNGYTPLHICCMQGHCHLLDSLINEYNSNVNDSAPESGQTPLHLAAIHNKTEIIKLLVKTFGALLSLKTKLNQTALDLAKLNNSTEAVKYIEKLADEISVYGSHDDWYHDSATSEEAILILDEAGRKDGLFLIIKSEIRVNNYSILFYLNKKLNIYEINYSKYGFKIGQAYKTFKTLESLVNYYCTNFTSLGCALNSSINKDRKIIKFANAKSNRMSMVVQSEGFNRFGSLRMKPINLERNRSSLRLTNSKRLNRILAKDTSSK